MSITIRDVAAAAGVSHQTVSKAINGRPRISRTTREHVLRVCERLGYVPNVHAQQLGGGRSRVVGIAYFAELPNFAEPAYGPMFQALVEQLSRDERDMLLLHMNLGDPMAAGAVTADPGCVHLSRVFRSRSVGSVLAFGDVQDVHFDLLSGSGIPCVYLGNYRVPAAIHQVDLDIAHACRILVKAVADAGYRRVLFAYPASVHGRDCFAGDLWACMQQAAAHATVALEPANGDLDDLCRRAAGRDADARTVVACNNDGLAANIILRARDRGYAIPEDFGVTGFGNRTEAVSLSPGITSIDLNCAEMARLAVNHIFATAADDTPNYAAGVGVRHHVRGSLIVRSSL